MKKIIWYLVSLLLFRSALPYLYGLKVFLLRLFGAKIGKGVVIKPGVNIKYPWLLRIGNHSWLGEGAWIDNLALVNIGNNVCISQGASILTGNHNYKKETFDLMLAEVNIEDGVWVGAKAIVAPGVRLKTHSVLSVASVAVEDTAPYTVYRGNPALAVRERKIEE
ncbi:MAG: WcaF family extracellular polysaccharide biosynthesis acetyltransferase [Candidatus Omnitrophota bacterium]